MHSEGRFGEISVRAVPKVAPYARQIGRHVRRTIGESTMVFHEHLPNGMPLDLHVIPPAGPSRSAEHPHGRDFITLVTSGMSTQPMGRGRRVRYAELMLALPRDWPGIRPDGTFDPAAMAVEENWWPIRAIKRIARLPLEAGTVLAPGALLPVECGRQSPAMELSHLMAAPSRLYPRSETLMVHDDITITFHALWALHADEAEFAANHGMKMLLSELDREQVTELVDVRRAGVLKAAPQQA